MERRVTALLTVNSRQDAGLMAVLGNGGHNRIVFRNNLSKCILKKVSAF